MRRFYILEYAERTANKYYPYINFSGCSGCDSDGYYRNRLDIQIDGFKWMKFVNEITNKKDFFCVECGGFVLLKEEQDTLEVIHRFGGLESVKIYLRDRGFVETRDA